LFFLGSLAFVVKSANLAIEYSTHVAKSLRISTQVVGFLLIAFISVLPETAISLTSAWQGVPSFGLGTLFGSNVADLTLVLALITFFAREIKVQKSILKMNWRFVGVMLAPLLMGLNGHYSRPEGILMMLLGGLFFYYILRKERKQMSSVEYSFSYKSLFLLLVCMAVLLVSAQFTVEYGVAFAHDIHLHPVFIGLVLVALGTTLPEFFFSLKAVEKHRDGLALGDILGTVIVGLIAVIHPFSFDSNIIYVTGLFMFLAAALLFFLMHTGRTLSKKEGILLLVFYVLYVLVEFLVNQNGTV
jgi:cation:H+ antiporter